MKRQATEKKPVRANVVGMDVSWKRDSDLVVAVIPGSPIVVVAGDVEIEFPTEMSIVEVDKALRELLAKGDPNVSNAPPVPLHRGYADWKHEVTHRSFTSLQDFARGFFKGPGRSPYGDA